MPDTWENRQGVAFSALVAEIDGCPSLVELGAIGKRLYALRLSHDQVGVAWTRYPLRQTALEAAVALGVEAQRLPGEIERASEREPPCLGVKPYRRQRCSAVTIAAAEWRGIWRGYGARRRACVG